MKRLTFLILSLSLGLPSLYSADTPAKKRVLLLGDSISMGYTPVVQKLMAEEAVVLRPTKPDGKAENCSGTTHGIANIDRWLQIDGGKWDVIHFNWGLHDIKHVLPDGKTSKAASDPPQATLPVYEKNLREIVAKLKATNAKLIFASTTPVPDAPLSPYRSNVDVIAYNEVALKIMKENNIAVDDLYAFAQPKLKELQIQPANVHFTGAGSLALGEEVTKSLRAALK